ncbi:HAD-IA family hydrolase [Arthrobacter sp. M4]|uniref:HAD-IA family hydrolase n=1 Tax=Arthrobacter sp. M4 TaxID=218160 RepID=UPI001CDD7875|nr:HAD-IA family hydrolase [Arthrobacter sp. M4]MCA4134464.1 HAD-IA family hydrolase [Arthrobacter sp. M4]
MDISTFRAHRHGGGSASEQHLSLAVLDMVGTTVTDGGRTERAMSLALAESGVEPGSARFEDMLAYTRETMGYSKMAVFSHLFEDPDTARNANKLFEQAYDELIAHGGIKPIPGAEETIAWMRDAGIKVCLATGFGRHTQNVVLESLGWMGLADLSLCPADAGRGRPYPDMILTAVLALDLDDVRNVAVVGDTSADVLSGLRAGASVVAGVLTGQHSEATLRTAGATAVVGSVKDLPALLEPRTP